MWLATKLGAWWGRSAVARSAVRRRPGLRLEQLEDRTTPAQLTVTSALDPAALTAGTLRYAVAQANADVVRGISDTIVFNLARMSTNLITLRQGELELGKVGLSGAASATVSINGGGKITISGNNADRVFFIHANTHTDLTGLTIENGHAGNGSAGGGIDNHGFLTLSNSTLAHNSTGLSGFGGGIYNTGVMTVIDTTVKANSSGRNGTGYGGGVFNWGTMTLIGATIRGNSAGDIGGGIDNAGNITLTSTTVSGNHAGKNGADTSNSGLWIDTSHSVPSRTPSPTPPPPVKEPQGP